MWRDFLNWFRLIWDTGTQTQKNTTRIEEVSKQNDDLAHSFEGLAVQQQHDREMAQERERRYEERIQKAEARIASLERELDTMKMMFNQRLSDEAEKIELRLRLEIAQGTKQLPPPQQNDK